MQDGINLNSESSWSAARNLSKLLSPIPATVTHATSVLWKNYCADLETGKTTVTSASQDALRRLERSSKLKAPLYFAATTLYPDRIQQLEEDDTSKTLLTVLTPGLFATLLGLVYFHKRLAKILENRDWSTLSKEYVLNMELGFLVGSSIPRLGVTLGTLLGGIRYAALATFFVRDPDAYSRYRNLTKRKFDIYQEHQRWGCDHCQVAAHLIHDLGFRKDLIEVTSAIRCNTDTSVAIPRDLSIWSAGLHWLEAVRDGLPQPTDKIHVDALQPTVNDLAVLRQKVENLFKVGSSFSWMFKQLKSENEESPNS